MGKRLLTPDLHSLLESWEIALLAENKAATTIPTYLRAARFYLQWCKDNGHPPELTRAQVQRYTAELVAEGKAAATVRQRQAALRQLAKWLADNDELPDDPLIGLKPVKVPTQLVNALTDEQLRSLLAACKGKSFRDRRDEAILRLMVECGLRATETVSLTTADVEPLKNGLVTIRRGKGGKGRTAPFSAQTAAALDRYLRLRRLHKLADDPALWLGSGGAKRLAYFGLNDTLRDRAKTAGIEGFHLHLLRHTAATRWLRAGGSEQGLMAVAGWSTRSMIDRYTGASAAERAAAEARGLNLGDL